jgi:hypothetical protein
MHTEELPYRSPAAIVSLRPVTLRPCFSASLPSGCRVLENRKRVKTSGDKRLLLRMNGNNGKDTFHFDKAELNLPVSISAINSNGLLIRAYL